MQPEVCICVFAKPPRAGQVKTRLARRTGANAAAELAGAFLHDALQSLRGITWAKTVIASTGKMPASRTQGCEVWLQGEGDLGARIERILSRALATARYAIAVGADSPGLPGEFLEQAYQALRGGQAVLGPCDDGGFYLLGVDRCPGGLLANIPWSRSKTLARTSDRLCSFHFLVHLLPAWFDVDCPKDLARLQRLVMNGRIYAPATASVLRRNAAFAGTPATRVKP